MSKFENLSRPVVDFVTQHLAKNNLEIEFRLGKKNGTYFDTNIGKDNFDKIHRRLSRYPSWESVTQQNAIVFYGARKGLRVVYDEDKDEQVSCIAKYKMAHVDQQLQQRPFDVRIAVSIENPVTYDPDKDTFVNERKRRRTSFLRKGLSIDMSIIESSEKDSENPFEYQVELEIVEPPSGLDDVKIANHYHKVFDVLNLLLDG
jgi:hypothetical protein